MPADPKPEDWSIVGVVVGCTRAEARSAYLTRVTALHPDRHPDLPPEERARLDRALAALNDAWARLESWPVWPDRPGTHDAAASDVEVDGQRDDGEPGARRRGSGWLPFQRLPAPPPGFGALATGPRGFLGEQLQLLGESRDLVRLADWSGVPYRGLRCNNRPLEADHLAVAVAALPTLRNLDLDGTGVGDDAVAHAARLEELVDLHLSDTATTDEGLRAVARLPRLESLSLVGTPVTDAGLAHLAGHRTLSVLNLRQTDVEGPGLAWLADCPMLRLLALPNVRRQDRRALAERRPGLVFT